MAAVMFDTHAVIKRLQESGFSEQQAEAVADVLQDTQKTFFEHLATKQDIQDLQRDLKESETNLRRDMKEMEITLRRDIDVKLAELKADLLKWTVGLLLAQAAVIATLVKLL